MKLVKTLAIMIAIILIGTIALAQPLSNPQVGDPALDFEIRMIDGETFKLSDHLGKVVFLNIWATWCGPCIMEMPAIEQLANAYPEDLVVIGVSCDDNEEIVKSFIEEQGYTYNIAWDENYKIAGLLYPSYAIPNSIFISPDGTITSMEMGAATYEIMEQRFLESFNSVADAASGEAEAQTNSDA